MEHERMQPTRPNRVTSRSAHPSDTHALTVTGQVALLDRVPGQRIPDDAPPAAAAAPGSPPGNAGDHERDRAPEHDRAQNDSDTLSYSALTGVLALAPVVGVLASRLPWDSAWLWLVRVALAGAVVYAVMAWRRVEPKAPRAPRGDVPQPPTREVVRLPRPAEPAEQVLDPAPACRICGRTLTERADRELGVDTTCYVQHGARRRYSDNPAYVPWQSEMIRLADREQQMRAEADERYRKALTRWRAANQEHLDRHEQARARWVRDSQAHHDFLSSPAGRERARQVRTARTTAAGSVGLLALALL